LLLFNAYCRKCFFTCYNPNQLKQDFMKCINYAVKGGGFLTCSSRDNEFGDFLLYKKQKCTAAELSVKSAVSQCGLQLSLDHTILPESVWVLGPDVIINTKGNLVGPKGSNFVWLSDIHPHTSWAISSSPNCPPSQYTPFSVLSRRPAHHHATQYLPCSYHLGSKCDDSTLLTNCTQARHCHIPMNVGASPTGKTTALQCALSLFGCHRHTFYSRGTKEAYLQKCCLLTLPVGCDNPQSSVTTVQWGEMYTCEKWRQDIHHQLYHLCEFQYCRNSQVRLCCLIPSLWLG